ncbi:MAG: hypothetical protein RIB03_12445 [Henriciella sp.]|uniref:hypothetical protein n=1 Tax=Henriciella sp. TaxID=1968823 RepID=UPI00260CD757|nr:hypothetical protein [Henriciella sp.]
MALPPFRPISSDMHWIAILIIAAWMLIGGTLHLAMPAPFYAVVPDWMPQLAVVWVSGLIELAIGIGVLIPRTRAVAGLAFAGLCLGYLPLHVWDFFRADPVFPVPWGASARIAAQMVLIWMGVWVWRRDRQEAV